MGNTQTKESGFISASASGDVLYIQQCMQADGRERLLSATTGFLAGRKTALHLAAKQGNAEVVASVLGPLVDAVTAEVVDGVYPGDATQLLGRIANQQDSRGRTPLLTACYHGHWDCAELLLEAGSNAFAADKDGNGILHLAAVHGHAQLVAQLLEKFEAQAITGRLAGVVNLSGFTPLHYAAWCGSAETVRQLLAAGVDQLQCNWGEYDRLVSAEYYAQAMALLTRRWLVVPIGSTALHVAAAHHHSGVCLLLLQSYAVQLREWLPGDPVPVDPRTRSDNKGELPVEVAIRTGLHPSSQLALCLQPSVNLLSVFGAQQLEDMRRRGPPALRVVAAAALRKSLLQQLGDLQAQQQLLLQQQHIEKQLRRQWLQKQQQQQQGHEEQGLRCSNNSSNWKRWWVKSSIGQASPTAAAAAAYENLLSTFSNSRAAPPANGANSSSSSNAWQLQQCVEGDHHRAELVHGLNRTPSITLGAVQYAKSAVNSHKGTAAGPEGLRQHHHHTGNQQAEQKGEAAAAAAAPDGGIGSTCGTAAAESTIDRQQLTAPTSDQNKPVRAAAAAAAAAAAMGPGSVGTTATAAAAVSNELAAMLATPGAAGRDALHADRPLQTTSITLGYLQTLDHEQQHEGNVAAAAAAAAAATAPQTAGTAAADGCNASCSSHGCSKTADCLGEIETSDHAETLGLLLPPQKQQIRAATSVVTGTMRGNSRSSSSGTSSSSPVLPGCAAPATPAAATSYQHINEFIHKSTGNISAFALVTSVPASNNQHHDNISSRSSSSNNSSKSGQQSSDDLQHNQVISQQTQPQKHQQQQSLYTSSITLAELAASSSRGSLAAACDADGQQKNSSNGSSVCEQPMLLRPCTPQQLLERPGMKGKTWEQFMTPRSWLLYQQQRGALPLRRQQQQQQPRHSTCVSRNRLYANGVAGCTVGGTAGSTAAAAAGVVQFTSSTTGPAAGSSTSSINSFAARRAALLLNVSKLPMSKSQRRSFELPGASAGMSALFGANRQHVARMLHEAGTVDPRTLYRTLHHNHGSLAVATSLAGALPGCISEKLVQVVDVGQSSRFQGGVGGVLRDGDCNNECDMVEPQVDASTAASADGMAPQPGMSLSGHVASVGRWHSEVCSICADKVPSVGLTGCGHMLCFDCVKCIVGEGVGCRPPLCPFCRRTITGVRLAAVVGAECRV